MHRGETHSGGVQSGGMKMKRHTQHHRRRGQVLIVAPAFVLVLCGMAILCVDVGHFSASRAVLQNAADAAALASVRELWEQLA